MLSDYGGRWQATLHGSVELRGDKSQLVLSEHSGPLRLQKALWPEGSRRTDPVHLLMIHPPGGIAGADGLSVRFDIGDDSHALITTPGAGKWYRGLDQQSLDQPASQAVTLRVSNDASLEWLPQEVIVHDGAIAQSTLSIELAASAAMLGCEILVLGRKAYGESFATGQFRQQLSLSRGGQLVWSDKSLILPQLITQSSALNGYHVNGVFWASAPAEKLNKVAEHDIEAIEAECSLGRLKGSGVLGISRVSPTLLLVRAVSDNPERLREAFTHVWRILRPLVVQRAAVLPRIWNT
jgi:urease accessory protein